MPKSEANEVADACVAMAHAVRRGDPMDSPPDVAIAAMLLLAGSEIVALQADLTRGLAAGNDPVANGAAAARAEASAPARTAAGKPAAGACPDTTPPGGRHKFVAGVCSCGKVSNRAKSAPAASAPEAT